MILFFVLKTYFKDVKELGKEKLAMSLGERLRCYFAALGAIASFVSIYILYYSVH